MKFLETFNQYIYDGGSRVGMIYIHAESREIADLIFEDLCPTSFVYNEGLSKAGTLLIVLLREIFPGAETPSLFAFYDESKFAVLYLYAIDRLDAENKKLLIDLRSFKFEKETPGEVLNQIFERRS